MCLPALRPGEIREHESCASEQRIILTGDVVDVRGHRLPSIRVKARQNVMWSHLCDASAAGRLRLPLVETDGGGQVELLGISTTAPSWDLLGRIELPEDVGSGEFDFGSVVMEQKVTVAGTFRTSSGLPIGYGRVGVIQQLASGHWERAKMSVMANKSGHFTSMLDVEDSSMPLAFYQFDPIAAADGRYLIETPIRFERGAKNVEVVMTPAVHLEGSIIVPSGIRSRDLRVLLLRGGCPPRTIKKVRRDGSFESWQPQGTFHVEVRTRSQEEPLARIQDVVLSSTDPSPRKLQEIRF